MGAQARLADGGRARLALADPGTVDDLLAVAMVRLGLWRRRAKRAPDLDLWSVARVALHRDLAGLTHDVAAVWALTAATVEALLARGLEPSVYRSVNLADGFAWNDRAEARYRATGL